MEKHTEIITFLSILAATFVLTGFIWPDYNAGSLILRFAVSLMFSWSFMIGWEDYRKGQHIYQKIRNRLKKGKKTRNSPL
jgi:hypothetical protein